MNEFTGAVLIGILIVVMLFYYMGSREKNITRRKQRRRFRPSWTSRNGETKRRRKS